MTAPESDPIPDDEWLDLARELDWTLGYVDERDAFPPAVAGEACHPRATWDGWREPYRVTTADYVRTQADKERSVRAVAELLGRPETLQALDRGWLGGLKLHAATLPLAEFAAVVGNLRAARFAPNAAWRAVATLGALDECRHAQIPLRLMHPMVRWDRQFDWTHRFYHSNNWVAVAARRLFDELLLTADPLELAVATNFVFETGFTNLQFVALSDVAHGVQDHLFEKMVTSIQTDEARHAQIGGAVLTYLVRHDKARAQALLDKWFWRTWLVFAVVTGITMDYLTPVQRRDVSFKQFMHEWIVEQFAGTIARHGLERPWYWDTFLHQIDWYHHMVYASAYSYRATVWFDMVLPGPEDRAWLAANYPDSWPDIAPIWDRIQARWAETPPGLDFAVHATAIPAFCSLCNLVLCGGTPQHNSAVHVRSGADTWIFCSEPCRRIFAAEPERYRDHRDIVKRVLVGEAPGNLMAFLEDYCGLDYDTWGKDAFGGDYSWLTRRAPAPRTGDDPGARPPATGHEG